MTKNPLINALSASAYIILVVSIINLLSSKFRDTPDTFGAPVMALFLFTLSAAVMVYVFLYQPFQLFMDGKKHEAANLFVRTIGIFAVLTVLVFILLLLRII